MLPRCLKVVKVVLGRQVAESLLMFFGSGKLYIPNQPTPDIVDCLGQEDAERLCEYFGGWMVYIPDVSHIVRNHKIFRDRYLGTEILSRRYGLRKSTIRGILRKGSAYSQLVDPD